MDSIQNWLTLHLISGLGPAGLSALLEHFGSPGQILNASAKELATVNGIKQAVINQITSAPPQKAAEQELITAGRHGVEIISWEDSRYPALLRTIYAPPPILYVKGALSALNETAIAVVGSRAATSYGLKIAGQISRELASRVAVVSGLALGVDSAAHRGALAAKGITIGVLACGLDIIYPPQNQALAEQIVASGGALISEYPFQTKPEAFRFPARNRIISGIGLGVLVVEAAERSGSLITARQALDEGREIFAIPGRVDSVKSSGTHRLLKDGAKLVHTITDIFEEFPALFQQETLARSPEERAETPTHFSTDELKIMNVLDVYPKHLDSITSETGLDIRRLNECLMLLELRGDIESLPGQHYRHNK